MEQQHEPPPKHPHLCNDCDEEYDCQSPECRRLYRYSHCPRCYQRAVWYMATVLQAVHVRIGDPVDTALQKAKKAEFNPRPKQPTEMRPEDVDAKERSGPARMIRVGGLRPPVGWEVDPEKPTEFRRK